ncbi:MAG: 16S rRNA (cytosine(967)-C(5))-methyltransferase RsmB [Betaproteobacteria bacterium]|nr:16S rRNA (cytosine(967)-C(5))-methyltransferase RsmB [Betaproteobacteria bacterium]
MEAAQRRAAALVHEVLRGRSLATLLGKAARGGDSDAALVQELAYGSLRWWGRIEALARQLYHKKPPRAEIRCLIGVALYQLLETTAPEFAVVDQAVLAANRAGFPGAKGLVNAVLREFLRTRVPRLAALAGDEVARYSHPAWWIARLKADHPQAWQDILEADNARPPLSLRANRRRCSREDLLAAFLAQGILASPVGESGLILARPQPVATLPGFVQGWFSVQDAGAQLAAPLLGAVSGMRVLDACAAPGGKTTHLLESAQLQLTAVDREPGRLARMHDNLARLGLAAQVRAGDARDPSAWWDGKPYDRILVDAPCTSSGVLRRHPDIKWLRRERDIEELASYQREIATALWPLLAPGGRMLYATCSVFRAENAQSVDTVFSRRPDARRIALNLPGAHEGQLLPAAREAAHNHDGFFYALLEKT